MRAHWKLILILGLVAALLLGAAAFWFLGDETISGWFETWAGEKEAAGDADGAEYWYTAALWKDPRNSTARVAYAALLAQGENWSQAEALLNDGVALDPGDVSFYIGLSKLYVDQDKLLDAAKLLDAVENQTAKMALQDMRPGTPYPSVAPGEHHQKLQIVFDCDADTYLRTDGTFPSITDPAAAEAALEEEGEFSLTAVSVAENGLVSAPFTGVYLLTDLVFEMEFADPVIETLVRMQLGQSEGPVISSDARGITELTNLDESGKLLLENGRVTTLEDLPVLKHLKSVTLTLEDGTDLTPLTELEELTELGLPNSGIDSTDAATLAQLTNLTSLELSGNQVSTLSVFEPMTGLRFLGLSGNNVADPAPLAALTGLVNLDLSFNAISDLSGLTDLRELTELNLSTNLITDLTPLVALQKLVVLRVAENQLTTLYPVKELDELQVLDASGNRLLSLEGLNRLSQLQELYVANNQLTTLDELSGTVSLRVLNLDGNQVNSLSPLSDLRQLTDLSAAKNIITSLSPLSGCTALVTVNVEYNDISSLSPLADLPDLREVRAFENPLESADLGEDVTVFYS